MLPQEATKEIQAVILAFEHFQKTLGETYTIFREETSIAPIKVNTAIKTLRQMRQQAHSQREFFQENYAIAGLMVANHFRTLDGRQTASLILWLEEYRLSSSMSTAKRIEMHLDLEEQIGKEIQDIQRLLKELRDMLKQMK